ncbi:hypothetical protein FEM33_11275 [Dyadobacter flavalbus]|uniref:Uncharacterized protein n=1 Tax=Dyadobacter flavalbus TaxID=2579942 RepID=A0A5M8QWG5_9BACT|nr:DUF6428 family protein [Dyadobacter flavalbus]KAA6439678.1 hypothetical protein FEM33_11275 [Dyadobacter flavalbus]
MNDSNPMNWQSFKSTLLENPDRVLQFQYAEGQFVDASYHITEIKQAPIVSVDCGGVMNSWTEIIVQLWEPSVTDTERSMKVSKALSIVNLVEKSLPLNPLGIVKIEFGNSKFDTRQMYPSEFLTKGDIFTVNLVPDFTQCKALTRNSSCGTAKPDAVSSCCGPIKAESITVSAAAVETAAVETGTIQEETKELELVGAENSSSCTLGGGCC